MTAYKKYHRNFRERRAKVLAEFDNKCFGCGVENRTLAFNGEGELYIIYLHIAHVFRHEKTLENAYLVSLCPKCHARFDRPPNNDSLEAIKAWKLIGRVAAYFIEKESKEMEGNHAESVQ